MFLRRRSPLIVSAVVSCALLVSGCGGSSPSAPKETYKPDCANARSRCALAQAKIGLSFQILGETQALLLRLAEIQPTQVSPSEYAQVARTLRGAQHDLLARTTSFLAAVRKNENALGPVMAKRWINNAASLLASVATTSTVGCSECLQHLRAAADAIGT